MTRASFLLIALSLVLPSCQSISLGGSEDDGGVQPGDGSPAGGSGGSGGTSAMDAAPLGGQGGGGASGTESCKGLEIPDFDCGYGTPTYVCVKRGDGWAWDYTCPEQPKDGGPLLDSRLQGDASGTCAPRTFDVDCHGTKTIYTCVQRGGEWVWDHTGPTDGGAMLDTRPQGDAPTCQGTSPAARTCRNTEADCIPSNCACMADGNWACTQDCLSLPRCGDGGVAPGCDVGKAAQAIAAAGMTIVGEAQTINEELPSNLSSGPNWGVKKAECLEGGYDLSSVAGKTVCLVSFDSTELCQNLASRVWVVMSDGVVRCIYRTAASNPGVYSVHDSSCGPSDAGAVSCPGGNPAEQSCRRTASDCIPSGCACPADGQWQCTADCRALPLCADGGASGT